MRIKQAFFCVLVLLCIACKSMYAQIAFSFLTKNQGVISTPSVNVAGNVKCVLLSGSAATLNIANNGRGLFKEACEELPALGAMKIVSISLNLFPNPVRNDAVLKAIGVFDSAIPCLIKLISRDGKNLFVESRTLRDLQTGYKIQATRLSPGTYFVVLEVLDQKYVLQFARL